MATEVRFLTWCDWHLGEDCEIGTPGEHWCPPPDEPSHIAAITITLSEEGHEPLQEDLCKTCKAKMPWDQMWALAQVLDRKPGKEVHQPRKPGRPKKSTAIRWTGPYKKNSDGALECPKHDQCGKVYTTMGRLVNHIRKNHGVDLYWDKDSNRVQVRNGPDAEGADEAS